MASSAKQFKETPLGPTVFCLRGGCLRLDAGLDLSIQTLLGSFREPPSSNYRGPAAALRQYCVAAPSAARKTRRRQEPEVMEEHRASPISPEPAEALVHSPAATLSWMLIYTETSQPRVEG